MGLIEAYERRFGHPMLIDYHYDLPKEDVVMDLNELLASDHPLDNEMSDDDARYYNKLSEYQAYFGKGIPRGYGAPETRDECYALMCECIERGRAYDPYVDAGIPRDAEL